MDPLNPERLATRIKKLKLDEASAVDDPANLTPGWLLTKSSADGRVATASAVASIRAALREELAPIATAIDALSTRLDGVEGR